MSVVLNSANSQSNLTIAERATFSVLVVEPDNNHRSSMKSYLRTLGFGHISDAPNHAVALERVQERKITHVIFDAKGSNMPAKEFLGRVLEMEEESICIPSSFEPSVDDVFDMLIMGAKGFLVKPFTMDTVDNAIVAASCGEALPDEIKYAKDRNEALVAVVIASLDKAATILRQARQFETAKVEIPRALSHFKRTSDLAKTFAKGGDGALTEAIETFCIDRSNGPASRLGRLRKRLRTSE